MNTMKRFVSTWLLLLWTAVSVAVQPISPTTTAALLAGALPASSSFENASTWKQHRSDMVGQWALLQQRVDAIQRWRREALGQESEQCKTLLYPFSGPDFLNAYAFFPSCDTYIMFGLEVPGQMPNFETMTEKQAAQYLVDMRVAFGDLLKRNYFITSNMATQLNTSSLQGVTPLIMATMGALQFQIKSVELVSLNTATGVKIIFSAGSFQKDQVLYYFSQDATNVPLSKNPQFVSFITENKQSYMFIKSASYLLHSPHFSTIQKHLLDSTVLLIQDDTGVPYKNLRGWQVTPYGKYLGPIDLFAGYHQPDLEAVYRTTVQPLPFPFGYRWGVEQSGLLVVRKR